MDDTAYDPDQLRRNLQAVRSRMTAALARSGRGPDDARLVAVTKTVDADTMNALAGLGVTAFGENRLQPALAKAPDVAPGPAWHMIGHLQRNKVRKALGLFSSFHAVDSRRLAVKIDTEVAALGLNTPVPVYVQVNVSGESTKYGLDPAETERLATTCMDLPGLAFRGLMTMAPYATDPEAARPHFAALRDLRNDIASSLGLSLGLSMGMSGDFEVALEEGATVIRVGSALFSSPDGLSE